MSKDELKIRVPVSGKGEEHFSFAAELVLKVEGSGQLGEIQCGFVTNASLAQGWASGDATLLLYASLLTFLFLNTQDHMFPISIQ